MRIPTPIQALSAAAALALLAGCSSGSAISPTPITPQGHGKVSQMLSHPMVAPGLAGRLSLGVVRSASRGVQHDFTATAPCTYLSDNLSASVNVYSNNLSLAGTITGPYGWGAYATGSRVFLGRNDGTGDLDTFHPCTGTPMGTSLIGEGTGGNAYGIAGFKNSLGHPQGYATDWPIGDIEYWANGTGTATSVSDPNITLPYFLDVDAQGRLYVVGYDASGNEALDRCNKTVTSCTAQATIPGGFPGGVQVSVTNQVYVNNQFGSIEQFNCSGTNCNSTPVATFTYSNGNNPLDYTAIMINKNRTKIVGANIYLCSSCSFGIAGDAQAQSLPLSSSVLGSATPGWNNSEPLGLALWKADAP